MAETGVRQGLSRASRGVGLGGHGKPHVRRRVGAGRGVTLALMIVPSVILVLLIYGYPLVSAAVESVHNGTLVNTGPYVGFHNFALAFRSPIFWNAAEFTLLFCVVSVFGSWIVGLGLALLLRRRVHATGLFKVLLLLPWVIPVIVSATSWRWLVASPTSPVPELANHLGLGTLLFLADPTLSKLIVCVFKVWLSFPFMMLMASAALAGVDEQLYEAARVDGATGLQQLFSITLPMIARSTYISWVLMFIFSIGDFQAIYLLTGGGPVNATNTLVVLAYTTVFSNFQTGPGIAIGFTMTVVSIAVAVVLFRRIQKVQLQ